MSDPVSDLLAAIEETERVAQAAVGELTARRSTHVEMGWAVTAPARIALPLWFKHANHNRPSSVLRHCKSDREIVDLYRLFRRSGSDDTADALGAVLRLRARAYGISVEEETTGE